MDIALIAEESKKELMTQFCIAYCSILSHHKLYTTSTMGHLIAEATGLKTERFLSASQGGIEQITTKAEFNEIDVLIIFRENAPSDSKIKEFEEELIRTCDANNIPVATNIATAEIVIYAVDRGDLDWRNYINPTSKYNTSKKQR